jgi:hypothetical protein
MRFLRFHSRFPHAFSSEIQRFLHSLLFSMVSSLYFLHYPLFYSLFLMCAISLSLTHHSSLLGRMRSRAAVAAHASVAERAVAGARPPHRRGRAVQTHSGLLCMRMRIFMCLNLRARASTHAQMLWKFTIDCTASVLRPDSNLHCLCKCPSLGIAIRLCI